ncbi:MAG TPA: HAD family phosphatase [Dehalococcoidia bacterium]|nr:HAD family phosphatase [Dehalococcoidia bacterium]
MPAVLFDMDGVLVDGEPLHFAAVNEILAEEQVELDMDTYRLYMGTTLSHTWTDLQRRFSLAHDFDYYAQRYDRVVMEQYRTQAAPMPGARRLLDQLQEANVPRAVASSSNRDWVETALGALGFRDDFQVIVAGDEVRNGKPDPEIYLTAAEKIGAEPTVCTVIEDAPAGIESGRRAGMQVVAVRTEMTEGLDLDGATRIIDSLEQFDLRWLEDAPDQGADRKRVDNG